MPARPFGQDKFVLVHGLQMHYVEWGTPAQPSLLLLHGFQSHAHTWDTLSLAMAETYHVVALDQRGHGDTSWAPDGHYDPEAFVHDIVGCITALNLAPTVLIGHSMGGRHAAMLAAAHPDLVRKVVIVDTAAEFPPAMAASLVSPSAPLPPLRPETFATFEEVIRQGLEQYPLTPEAELRHANYHNLWRGADGQWRWRWDLHLLEWRRRHRHLQRDLYLALRQIHCPTLLIRGQRSPLLTPEVAQKMIQALPQGRLVEVADAAHTVHADNAAAFHAATAAFLRE
ncbi:MAG: alpha/beta fold hydrolase [Candidatus Tectimicrobiota bacterium]